MRAPAPSLRFAPTTRNGFYPALQERVREEMRCRDCDRYSDWRIAVKGAVYGGLAAGCYVGAVLGGFSDGISLGLALLYGVAVLLLGINLGHDAAHDCLCRSRLGNRLVLITCFTLIGLSGYLWRMRHVRSHHVFPNVNGCDIDIDENPFLRLSPNHPRRHMHRFQQFYAPLVYAMVYLHTVYVQDFIYLFKRDLANMHDIRHPRGEYAVFAATKAGHLAITLMAPMMLSPFAWWQVLIAYITMAFGSSALFVYLLIGTHFCEEVVFPRVATDGQLSTDWATHALATSADWSPKSRLAALVAGGANAHAAHHLFPNVCHTHYRWISPIIADAAADFGIQYNAMTLPAMIASHFRLLRRLGRPE